MTLAFYDVRAGAKGRALSLSFLGLGEP